MNEIDPNVVDEVDDFEGAYQLANTIVRECREAMEDHALESALLLLREAAERIPSSHELHSMAAKALQSALCVRYTRHGFPEDLMSLVGVASVGPTELSSPTVVQDTENEEETGKIELALELIEGYRRSASMANLNSAAYLYEIALSDGTLTDPGRLPLLLAAADCNCLRNAIKDSRDVLDMAVAQLEEVLRLKGYGDHSVAFCSLLSLSNAYRMKWLQDCNGESAWQAWVYLKQALQLDEEARSLLDSGTKAAEKFEEGGGLHHLEVAITQLKRSVLRRPHPHPHRSDSLNNLANALMARFEQKGILLDLEESIKHNHEALGLLPSPHPLRSGSLNNLAIALMTRWQRGGVLADLEESIKHNCEALELRPSPHPDRSMSLSNLANALKTRFEQKGVSADLEESIKHNRAALGLRPSPHPNRSASLSNLASALTTRFQQKGVLADLEESIKHNREALGLLPSPHPDRSTSLNNLATTLTTRFKQKGVLADLEESIKHNREALGLRPSPHPDRSMSLNNLANALMTRFEQKGILADLEESIKHNREALGLQPSPHPLRPGSLTNLASALRTRFQQKALGLRPSPHPNRSASLSNLASALRTRFQQKGVLADLEESIKHNREALGLRPSPHPDRSGLLNNLAIVLNTRFEHKGVLGDLEESIKHNREALGLLPCPHPDRSTSLNNLANVLTTRFKQKGVLADLEESIKHNREALGLRPSPHPDRSGSLINLANALMARFQQKGVLVDLEESIKHNCEALGLQTSPHSDRSMSLNNLANALKTRFEQNGVLADLEESIKHNREALGLLPPPHADRSDSLNNLALALLAYDKSQHGTQNQAEAFSLFEESARYPYGSLFARLRSASRNWATAATELNHPSALSAYQCATGLLPRLASIDLDPQHRQDVLVHAKDLATNATRCAIEAGKFEDAVVFSSTARAVFWSQSLQLRSPLDKLQLVSPQIAERLRFLGQALEKRNPAGTESVGIDDRRNLNDKHATYFRELAEEWHQTLEEVRKHPGFEDFFKLPSFSSLRGCAKRGPVVLLNASDRGCDALIITKDSDPRHIPLHGMTLELLLWLSALLQPLIAGKAFHILSFLNNRDMGDYRKLIRTRQGRIDPEDGFRQLLGILWDDVVFPVVNALKLDKSATPTTRIWWCPSGAFSFLPIHAAGIYAGTDSNCLHDYAISSYCSSLQSLLTPLAPIEPDYKFLAIIEPEAPAYGACALPMTKVELEKIQGHLPQPHATHLVKHVGVAGSWTSVDKVLSDLRNASFVHFGCHGMQERNPLDSFLLLSGGRLTMSKIVQCQASKASLAYLSACETAQHDKDRPDESLHLAATMMFAGFRSVVATLWSIGDKDAPVVADAFYKHLFRQGSTQVPDVTESAYALHLGVKALRDRRVGFRFWVPFVHYGL